MNMIDKDELLADLNAFLHDFVPPDDMTPFEVEVWKRMEAMAHDTVRGVIELVNEYPVKDV
jgi:hypothetical protein